MRIGGRQYKLWLAQHQKNRESNILCNIVGMLMHCLKQYYVNIANNVIMKLIKKVLLNVGTLGFALHSKSSSDFNIFPNLTYVTNKIKRAGRISIIIS